MQSGGPPLDDRRLVVIELPGGNDGLSTLIPIESGRYHDLRPTTALEGDEHLPLGDGLALNSALVGLHDRGLAILTGVGARTPSLSHFDMLARWWAGTPNSAAPTETAFLGRVCDRLGEPDELVGLSIGILPSPGMTAATGRVTSRPDPVPLTRADGRGRATRDAFVDALTRMGVEGAAQPSLAGRAAANLGAMVEVDRLMTSLPPAEAGYPAPDDLAAEFSAKLAFAGQILRSDVGVRVIHVVAEGLFFDSHENHVESHARSLGVVVPAIERFRAELDAAGLADRVLIATTSEFGRRPEENAGGTDHGTASCALLMGPVAPGVHGEQPSLTRLDRDGNQIASLSFDRYYATLATWLGVDPHAVLDSSPEPVPDLLTAS